MSIFDSQGSPQFGLADVRIAAWDGDGTYGTLVDVPSVQEVGVTLRVQSAELTGDDAITAIASRIIAAGGTFRHGSIDVDVLEVLIGNTATSSIASPNNVKNLRVRAGDNLPYFGLIGKALAEEGGGDFWVFLPKCRVTSDMAIALRYGEFAIPEMQFVAVDDADWGLANILWNETAAAISVMPPANIVQL